MKRFLSILITVIMLAGVLAVPGVITASAADLRTGDLVTFGSYPQTRVTDPELLSALNSKSLNWTNYIYGYYDDMKYADVTVAGEKYRAVSIDLTRPDEVDGISSETVQEANGYTTGQTYWFRFDPIVWRVLDPSAGLLMTEDIIDSQPVQNKFRATTGKPYYDTNWAYSSLRSWMNADFYDTAFSAGTKSFIKDTSLTTPSIGDAEYDADPTTDKVFPLSYADVLNEAYGFSSSSYFGEDTNRIACGTDYAKCQGLFVRSAAGEYNNGASFWYLRNPYSHDRTCIVSDNGYSGATRDVCSNITGIRPALNVDLQSAISQSVIKKVELPQTGDLVTFGSYPQTRVTDPSLLSTLNAQSLNWTYYDYYVNNAHEDFMKYADVTVSGEKYRAVTFSHYRPTYTTGSPDSWTDQYYNDYEPGTVYWFRFEPIVWRVLDPSAGLLMTESIIDSQPFHNELYDGYGDAEQTHYVSDWAYSSLRSWMNADFYDTAFNAEKGFIKDTSLTTPSSGDAIYDADPTIDRVFLLSKADATNEAYGFSYSTDSGSDTHRTAFGTDYAKCQGLKVEDSAGHYYSSASTWRMRTSLNDRSIGCVSHNGLVGFSTYTNGTGYGIRPVLEVSFQAAIRKGLIKTSSFRTGDLVTFGAYPQTRVTDPALLSALNSQTLDWTYYDYYVGGAHEDFMKYADVTVSGVKYRAVQFSHYRPIYTTTSSYSSTYQEADGYEPGQVYWFRFEPIVWRVLDPSAGLLMTESILDSQAFNNDYYEGYGDAEKTHYASNWAYSSLRSWMNGDFYDTAFDDGKGLIKDTALTTPSIYDAEYDAEPTTDKVFTLSLNDALYEPYGFTTTVEAGEDTNRTAYGTDYAKCQGLQVDVSEGEYYSGASWWSLRTPYDYDFTGYVDMDSRVDNYSYTDYTYGGIRPALKVDLKSAFAKALLSPYDNTEPLDYSRVTLSWTIKEYKNSVQKPAVTVKNAADETLAEGTDYTLEWSSGESKLPGIYTVTVNGKGNYSGYVSNIYTIEKQALSASRITLSWTGKTYNGEVQQPTVTVKNSAGAKLTEGTSYTLEWSGDSKLPGTYTVTVKAKGDKYSGSVDKTYTISKQPLEASRIRLSWTSKPYNSDVQKPTVTVKNAAGVKLTAGTSYTLEWSGDSKLPGTYTVTVKGKGNFSGSVPKTYTIGKQALAASRITLSWTSKTYNSAVQKPTVTVKNEAGTKLTEGTSYTLEWSGDSKLPGTYTVTVKGKGSFSGSVPMTYTIGKQPLAASRITLSWTNKAYNGSVQKPTVAVKNAAGTKLTEGTSYILEWSEDSKLPGTYTVTVKGKGSFSGSVPMTYTISKQALNASRITLSWTSKAYNGEVQKPTVTVKNTAGLRLTEGTSYTLEWSEDSKLPGTYTVTVKAKGDKYSGSVPMTYTISKQALNASRITLSWTGKAYNGEVQKPTVTVKNAAGLRLTEGTSYTLEWSEDSKLPGTYTVTVKAKGDKYSGSVPMTYTISKQALAESRVTLSWTSKTYNGKVQKPTVTVKNAAGLRLTEGTSYTLTWSGESKQVGDYTVTVTATGDKY
nr:DUF6273 domain-containing protein [Clostridia bacterium]